MFEEVSRIARIAVERVTLWHTRARERRVLSELDEHTLRDIGLTRWDARAESDRPFWEGDDRQVLLRRGSSPSVIGQTSHSWV